MEKIRTMNNLAYIRGVMDGDGCVEQRKKSVTLRVIVTSHNFATAIFNAFIDIGLAPSCSERDQISSYNGYTWSNHLYDVKANCKEPCGLLQLIAQLDVTSSSNKLDYLIGFFQAEGCFRIQKYPNRECWMWQITNKDLSKLHAVQSILASLGIKSGIITKKDGISMLYVQRRTDIMKLLELGVAKK